MTFLNRFDAGRQLGAALLAQPPPDPIVLGVLRGGVPVAAEVARILDDLDRRYGAEHAATGAQ